MAKNFRELEHRMGKNRRAAVQAKTTEILASMLLSEVRRGAGMTQVKLAKALGIKQPTLSKLESLKDMQITTLQRVVTALGGELEIIAHLPSCDVRLGQFETASV